MIEGIVIGILAVVMLTFFGLRRILFGDHPMLKNRRDIQELLTGSNQTSMLESAGQLHGKIGKVYTVLKPGGKIIIDDEFYEATTGGEYIDKGEKVKVIGRSLGTLKVRKVGG